jgi:uncharacterized DUF497 family protein
MYNKYRVRESLEFDWDEHNERHLAKHGISRLDAEDILSGDHILLEYQTQGDEERWVAVGITRAGRILNVVFAVRDDAVRPITGWVADKETADLFGSGDRSKYGKSENETSHSEVFE